MKAITYKWPRGKDATAAMADNHTRPSEKQILLVNKKGVITVSNPKTAKAIETDKSHWRQEGSEGLHRRVQDGVRLANDTEIEYFLKFIEDHGKPPHKVPSTEQIRNKKARSAMEIELEKLREENAALKAKPAPALAEKPKRGRKPRTMPKPKTETPEQPQIELTPASEGGEDE